MEKILAILGLTGKKSGGGTVQILARHKKEVFEKFPGGIRAIVRKTSDTSKIDALPFEIEKRCGELSDADFLEDALRDVDTVLHITGINNSKYVVNAAVNNNVRRLICVHTTGIYSKYKAAGERYRQIDEYVVRKCKENSIALTILRPTMVYGNVTDSNVVEFIGMVDRFPIMPVVNHARYELQPVHYMDLSEAYYRIVMNDSTMNHDYILSGGRPILLKDMLQVIGKDLGKEVHFFSVPFPIAYAGACVLYALTLKKIDYRERVQRLCEPRIFSHEEAERDFGYSPRNFEDGVAVEVEEYKKMKRK